MKMSVARGGRLVALMTSLVLLAAGTAAGAASAAATTTGQRDPNPWPDRRVLNIAHQGGELEAPSNTLYAFKTAIERGADVIELDVHATADRELVVVHDDTVDRTTDGNGRVDELTLEQIQGLDAAYWFVPDCGTCPTQSGGPYPYRGFATGEVEIPPELGDFEPGDFTVPSLREVLETFPDTYVNIEIKATIPDTAPYERTLADMLAEHGRGTDTIVTSFHDIAVTRFQRFAPQVSAAPGMLTVLTFWAAAQGPLPGIRLPGMHALQVPVEYEGVPIVTERFVTKAHRNGLAVHVWTVDDRAEMEWLIDIGVDGIMTNRPTLLAEVLDR